VSLPSWVARQIFILEKFPPRHGENDGHSENDIGYERKEPHGHCWAGLAEISTKNIGLFLKIASALCEAAPGSTATLQHDFKGLSDMGLGLQAASFWKRGSNRVDEKLTEFMETRIRDFALAANCLDKQAGRFQNSASPTHSNDLSRREVTEGPEQ
jgi:hypothetical protein